jgi:hypothetical protein
MLGAALLLCAGCLRSLDEEPPPPGPIRPARSAPLTHGPSLEELADAGASRRPPSEKTLHEIARVREEILGVTPVRVPTQSITFAGHRLAFIAKQAVRIESLEKPPFAGAPPKESLVIPLSKPHRLVTLVGDLLLACGGSQTFALPVDRTKPRILGHIALLGETLLLTDVRWENALTTFLSAAGTLSTYVTEDPPAAGFLLPRTQLDYPTLVPLLCGIMRDGALLCVGNTQVHRGYPGLPLQRIGTIRAGAEPFRVLPGTRADRFVLARTSGQLEQYSIIAEPQWVSTTELPPTPYDIAEGAFMLGVLSFDQDSQGLRLPRVSVLASDGSVRYTKELVSKQPRRPPGGGSYVAETSRWEIALHPKKPWLVIRSPERLQAINYTNGRSLFELELTAP